MELTSKYETVFIVNPDFSEDAAKGMLDKKYKQNADLIVADNADVLYSEEKEQEGEELVTVLTRYFRKDGEVWSCTP